MVDVQFKTMFRDYRDSWASGTGAMQKRARRRAAAYFYLPPTAIAAVLICWHVGLTVLTPYLTAMSVFTALLFGLLYLVFNLAVTLRKDGSAISNAHGLEDVVVDLRSTITYTIVIAIMLVVVLAAAAGFMVPSNPKDPASTPVLPWQWSPILAWLAVHLLLNVLKILERFRTAFNYVIR